MAEPLIHDFATLGQRLKELEAERERRIEQRVNEPEPDKNVWPYMYHNNPADVDPWGYGGGC